MDGDPAHLWQFGTNDSTNRLLRPWLTKGLFPPAPSRGTTQDDPESDHLRSSETV